MTDSPRHRIELSALVVSERASVLDGLRVLDRTGLGVIFIQPPDGALQALVTDGDVRRFLIHGGSLERPLLDASNPHFYRVGPEADPADVSQVMMERGYDVVPVVDEGGRLVHLHTLRDIVLRRAIDSWAVVMAGGKGERLGQYTEAIPKPMLPVGGRPILERIVRQLVSHGFRRIYLAVNHMGQMVQDHFGNGTAFQCEIGYLREPTPLGTGGPLGLLPERPSAPLLVMNGDLLTSLDFTRLLRFHQAGSFLLTAALREHRVAIPYGVATLEQDRITSMSEKPAYSYQVNAGMYVVDPQLLEAIPQGTTYPITELIGHVLSTGGRVGGYTMHEDWVDIGLPHEYERAQAAVNDLPNRRAR